MRFFPSLIALLLVACSVAPQATATPTGPDWRAEFDRHEAAYRATWNAPIKLWYDATIAQGDGSLVGWVDGAAVLSAYLDIYEATGEVIHLDRFRQRANQLLSLRTDIDGDGFAGWPTGKYSENWIKNGDFERGGRFWQGIGPSATVATHTPESASPLLAPLPDPSCAGVLAPEPQKTSYLQLSNGGVSEDLTLFDPIRSRFKLQFNTRIDDGAVLSVQIETPAGIVLDQSVSQSATRGDTGWQKFETDVNLGGATTFTVRFSAGGGVALDNIELQSYEEYLAHEFLVGAELARFAILTRNSKRAGDRTDAATFVAAVEQMVVKNQPEWRETEDGRATYIARMGAADRAFQGSSHPYNITSIAGLALAHLGRLGLPKSPVYADMGQKLTTALLAGLYDHPTIPGAKLWPYREAQLDTDADLPERAEDMGHANFGLRLLGTMYRYGLIDGGDVEAVAKSVRGAWDGKTTFAAYLDGTGILPAHRGPPFRQHLEITREADLRAATAAGWELARDFRACQLALRDAGNGALMAVPALMLLSGKVTEDRSGAIQYDGRYSTGERVEPWYGIGVAFASGGTLRRTNRAGSTATWRFHGTRAIWMTARGPDYGYADILVDGTHHARVNTYAAAGRYEVAVDVAPGAHVLTVKMAGVRPAGGNGASIVVDGFRVP